jgi:tetratricopeptide (TPR) repeat protein
MQGITDVKENTVGYFLKEIRKKYCLDQKDLCGGNVKRSKVAKIEINDGSIVLTEEYAKEIAKNINAVISKYEEEIDYLFFFDNALYKIKQKATECADEILLYFNKNDYGCFTKTFIKFTTEYSQYNIPEIKLKVFVLAGKYAYKHKEYLKCYNYYNSAVDNAIAANDFDELIKCKIQVYVCLVLMGDCNEGLKYIRQLLKNEKKLTNDHKYSIYHKIGYAYLALKDYETALNEFEKAGLYVDNTNIFYVADLYHQRAYCYRFMLKIPEAIDTLKKGIEYLNTELYEQLKFRQDLFENKLYFTKLSLVNNLVCAYRYIGDKESMKLHIERLLLMMNPNSDKLGWFMIDIYSELFEHYMYLEDYALAGGCIAKAFHLSIEQENVYYENEILKNIFRLYEQKGDKEKVNNLLPYIKSMLAKYPDKINEGNIAFTCLVHYLEANECMA